MVICIARSRRRFQLADPGRRETGAEGSDEEGGYLMLLQRDGGSIFC
jgi:hypothetical protein